MIMSQAFTMSSISPSLFSDWYSHSSLVGGFNESLSCLHPLTGAEFACSASAAASSTSEIAADFSIEICFYTSSNCHFPFYRQFVYPWGSFLYSFCLLSICALSLYSPKLESWAHGGRHGRPARRADFAAHVSRLSTARARYVHRCYDATAMLGRTLIRNTRWSAHQFRVRTCDAH